MAPISKLYEVEAGKARARHIGGRSVAISKKVKPTASWEVSSTTLSYARDRLGESGLTLEEAETLGMALTDNASTLADNYVARPALILNYRDPWTGKPLSSSPAHPPFHRIRYLGPEPVGFKALSDEKPRRYAQPPNSGLCAYFPVGLGVDWNIIFNDLTKPIIITEGEIKACAGCKEDYATIGLGGVWNWRSAANGIPLLPEIEAVPWIGRRVFIVFDSDIRTNPNVLAALHSLAETLFQRGAMPMMAVLPEIEEGRKTGLDDYIVAQGGDALDELLTGAQHLTLARSLFSISKEVVYVRDPGIVVVRETNQRISPNGFTAHAYAARIYHEQVIDKDGNFKLKSVKAAQAWMSWPIRAELGRMTYAPGEPKETTEGGVSAYNLWEGWGCEPKKGNVKPFLQLIKHIFLGAEEASLDWFMRWLAYPIQHPGAKMFSSSVIWGTHQGTGKSLIGYSMKRIYGKNFTKIGQAELEGQFTEWAENKQFVLGDDVTGSNKRAHVDLLKKMITQEEIRINVKNIPSYEVPDRINYLFTSNNPDAFFMDDEDRRYFVHEVKVTPLPDEFYVEYKRWLNEEGPSALFHYLQNLDLGDFNPAAAAFKTAARDRMIADGRSDLGTWVATLKLDPTGILSIGEIPIPGDLFTAKELLDLYDPLRRQNISAAGLARELRRQGFNLVLDGAVFRSGEGKLERFYAVRGDWLSTNRRKVEKHLEERYTDSMPTPERKY